MKSPYLAFPEEENVEELLQCLLQNSNKIKVLYLPISKRFYELKSAKNSALLSQLLMKNSNWLTNLELFWSCNDHNLWKLRTIGENCHYLQHLNIEMSTVSDQGIQALAHILECRVGRIHGNDEEEIDESLIITERTTEHITKLCNVNKNHKHICCYLCYKTKLCHSLRCINLSYTQVTQKGTCIDILLSAVNNLQDIGTL